MRKEQGLVWFYKKTNTDESVEGWHITVYSDEACTQKVGTLITNEDGRAGYYLDPGTYWAKETGDEHGRFEDEYWMVDETVQKFEIKPHEDVSITFTNVQYGRLKITKTVESDGSVEGWQFKITDAEGKVLDGAPFATNEDGIILTGNLLPGIYTVEEIMPEDSLYECKGDNPQTVTITQGEIAEAAFVNALRTGKVTVEKIDITGSPLAGATFQLEWSAEGSLWYPVTYSESIIRGGCSNPDITDGCLTTGADGLLEWDNLYPGLQYRLTETKAPDGYKLLEKAAYEGELWEAKEQAEIYNHSLIPSASTQDAYSQEGLLAAAADYDNQFNLAGNGIMGYVEITGHSLSVSDIVALKQDSVVSYHYCDSVGFKELPDFQKENYLKAAEMSTEDDYGMIDGIINNGKQPTVAELEQQAKSGQPISLMDLADAVHREKKPSVLEKLKDQPQQPQRKSKPRKSKEQEL